MANWKSKLKSKELCELPIVAEADWFQRRDLTLADQLYEKTKFHDLKLKLLDKSM